MKQQTISDVEYSARKRKSKREKFLELMEEIIPWEEWVAYIAPYYPSGKRGRPPKGIEKMLRMYLLQCWFSLSDEGVEDSFSCHISDGRQVMLIIRTVLTKTGSISRFPRAKVYNIGLHNSHRFVR